MKKIKTKIFLGILLLFLMIILIGSSGITFVNQLSQSSKGTIKNNYWTIDYVANMTNDLQDIYEQVKDGEIDQNDLRESLSSLDSNITLESRNITEPGEEIFVRDLQNEFSKFSALCKTIPGEQGSYTPRTLVLFEESFSKMRDLVKGIYGINMDAVYRRNSEAEKTANKATIIMILLVSVSVLVSIHFIMFFPPWIVDPIVELDEKINAIASGKYDQELRVDREDEIGRLTASFNIMTGKLKEFEESSLQKILTEKKRLDSIIQNLQDGVIILDENGIILKMSRSAYEITGLSESNAINKPAAEVALINDLFRTILKQIDKEEEEETRPLKIAVKGQEQYFKVQSINIIRREEGVQNEIGKVILVHNVTSFEKRDTAKTNLIATVSHELKTPISSINLSLRLLDDNRVGELNDEQKKLVYSLRQQSNRLSKVINELLDFSQAETGNIKLNITSVAPEDIIDLSITALMMIMSEKSIKLETEMGENLPVIKADLEKTVWVLVNILGNAVRFTPAGGTITLSVKQENGSVKFSVKDEGPGIPEQEKNKVFDKFVQVGKPSSGTGLGLAIAKEFVQCQGGEIGVRNNKEKGAEFYFKLSAVN